MGLWRLFGWSSSLLLFPSLCLAAWSIAERPLDSKPYTREYSSNYSIGTKSLIHLEGSAKKITSTDTSLFSININKTAPNRYLEFQLGYLNKASKIDSNIKCKIEMRFQSKVDTEKKLQLHSVPLRSVDPGAIEISQILKSYDYFMPMFRFNIPSTWQDLTATAHLSSDCSAGEVIFYDPKIWHRINEKKPKRFFLIITDSLSDDWFKRKRRFMPGLQDFFTGTYGGLMTNVVSVGTNTLDTTRTLVSQTMSLRDGKTLIPRKINYKLGLATTFLNAGYDAISFNSNYLLSADYSKSGFRSFTNFNLHGSEVNRRNPEILVNMTLDWLKRHADHDVFFFLWFDSTHVGGFSGETRKGFNLKNVPYAQPLAKDTIHLMAESMSYEDIHFERLFSSPLVKHDDILFSTDHGINYDTLKTARPAWGACKSFSIGANWHLDPVEVMIPVGLRLKNGKVPKNIGFKTSLLDWLLTAVQEHNPDLDTGAWLGQNLNNSPKEQPVLALSHGGRAAVFYKNKRILISDEACTPTGSIFFLNDKEKPASNDEARVAILTMLKHMDSKLISVNIDMLAGDMVCKVKVISPLALVDSGSNYGQREFEFDRSRWYASEKIFYPQMLGSKANVIFETSPPNCAKIRAGRISRDINQRIESHSSGVHSFLHAPKPRLKPEKRTQILIGGSAADSYMWRNGRIIQGNFGKLKVGSKEKEFSAELKAAMKRWGYIQDDD